MTVHIEAAEGRILARIINLVARAGCKVSHCELVDENAGAKITATFDGEPAQLKILGGQLGRLLRDESASLTVHAA